MSNEERPPDDQRQGIQSVETASAVLFALERAGGPMSLNALAKSCNQAPNKIHRYLVSLGRMGLTTQSARTGQYDLGPSLRRLGAESLRRTNEVAVASEHAVRLSEETGFAVNLAAWGNEGPLVVRWDYGNHPLSLTARIGASLPLRGSAAGQVFLAHLPKAMTEPVLAAEGQLSQTDLQRIEREKAQVLRQGYAVSHGGVITSQVSYAVPVLSPSEPMPMVLTVVMPMEVATPEDIERSLAALKRCGRAISDELGAFDAENPSA